MVDLVLLEEIRGISYGVIKMNIDTDLQFAFTEGIRDYMVKNIEYLKTQIGNPEGADVPIKTLRSKKMVA
jgi:fructose-bisphosphate aldolase class II